MTLPAVARCPRTAMFTRAAAERRERQRARGALSQVWLGDLTYYTTRSRHTLQHKETVPRGTDESESISLVGPRDGVFVTNKERADKRVID